MKVFWKDPSRLLQMEAESADDLNTLAGLLHGGPIKNAEWLKCPEDELEFACRRSDGITTFMGGCAKVVGCVWDVASHIQHESEAQAGSQAIRALRQMLGLGLGERSVPQIVIVSDRERALLSALAAIVLETVDYPGKHPYSADSYLPVELISPAVDALGLYMPGFLARDGVPA